MKKAVIITEKITNNYVICPYCGEKHFIVLYRTTDGLLLDSHFICPKCKEEFEMIDDVSEFKIIRDAFVKTGFVDFLEKIKETYIICPYCNHKIKKNEFFGVIGLTEKGITIFNCPECGNEFNIIPQEETRTIKEINMLSEKIRELEKENTVLRIKNGELEGDYEKLDICYRTTILEKERLKQRLIRMSESYYHSIQELINGDFYISNKKQDSWTPFYCGYNGIVIRTPEDWKSLKDYFIKWNFNILELIKFGEKIIHGEILPEFGLGINNCEEQINIYDFFKEHNMEI